MEATEQQATAPDPTVERIRGIMERRGLNQAATGRYLGVPQGTIGNWLAGTRKPNKSVERLLDVLGTIEALAPALDEHFLKG